MIIMELKAERVYTKDGMYHLKAHAIVETDESGDVIVRYYTDGASKGFSVEDELCDCIEQYDSLEEAEDSRFVKVMKILTDAVRTVDGGI